MSIIWKYLDKRSAAVDALKDYGSMKFIIGHTDEEVKSAYEKMEGVSSPQPVSYTHLMFVFYGANRTGRFSGRLIQLQNLYKNTMPDLAQARACLLYTS